MLNAGLERSEPPIYISTRLREIGEQLYACGGGSRSIGAMRAAGNIAGDLRQPVAATRSQPALNPIELADDFSDIDGTATKRSLRG